MEGRVAVEVREGTRRGVEARGCPGDNLTGRSSFDKHKESDSGQDSWE